MSTPLDVYAILSPSQLRRLRDNTVVSAGGTVEPEPVGTRPKIGVYTQWKTPASDIAAYESFLGRQVDLVLEFQGTENTGNLAWPSYFSSHFTAAFMGTRRLLLGATLSPVGLGGGTRQQTWAQLASGTFDTVWTTMAQNLVASGQADCTLRGAHEFNEDFFPHRVLNGEQSAFIDAWQRWHGICRANGFTGRFNWNPTTGDYNANGLIVESAYPGDAYVDTIDLDLYDRWYARGATASNPRTLSEQQAKWNDHLNRNEGTWRGLKWWRQFAVDHGKQLGFSEWGLGSYFNQSDGNHGGGDNELFIHNMADFILDPAYPPTAPGGVYEHAVWEHGNDGLRPMNATNPDEGRAIPVPKARAAFLQRFGGA